MQAVSLSRTFDSWDKKSRTAKLEVEIRAAYGTQPRGTQASALMSCRSSAKRRFDVVTGRSTRYGKQGRTKQVTGRKRRDVWRAVHTGLPTRGAAAAASGDRRERYYWESSSSARRRRESLLLSGFPFARARRQPCHSCRRQACPLTLTLHANLDAELVVSQWSLLYHGVLSSSTPPAALPGSTRPIVGVDLSR